MRLEARDISFKYGEGTRQILNHVTLTVEAGEKVGIMAPSGYGKTTLCKILAGYEEKLHLVERFWKTKEDVSKIRDLSLHYNKDCIAQTMEEINQISGRILEEL